VGNVDTSSTIQVLTDIWQRLLQLPSVSPEDNFFEFGGDSALAVQLFSEIADATGQQFPPVMIYHVPTIASLAALLEQRSSAELSPLILLKKGTQGPPLFIASGLGGGPAEFFQLVKHVDTPNSVFGLQPKGIEGLDTPCDRIEDMADFYLKAVRRFQPDGPYILAGYSLGGLVTLEMARTLRASDQTVALLLMIDSYPDIHSLSSGQFLKLLAQRGKRRVVTFGKPPRPDIRLGGLSSSDAIPTFAPAFERVRDAAYQALRRYKPRSYSGAVKFIRAAQVTEFPGNPRAVWSHLIPELEVETVPGNHLGMLTKHYEELGGVLSRYLKSPETR
jgi:thioesterase domain-containing protein/acyl carrier protein